MTNKARGSNRCSKCDKKLHNNFDNKCRKCFREITGYDWDKRKGDYVKV